MNGSGRVVTGLVCAVALVAAAGSPLASADQADGPQLSVARAFVERLDLESFRIAAVQNDGRVQTVDSFARRNLRQVNSRLLRGHDPVVVLLDLILMPEHWAGVELVHVKKEPFRIQLVAEIRNRLPADARRPPVSDEDLDRFLATGLASFRLLDHPATRDALAMLERDIMRTNKEVQKVRTARALADAGVLRSMLRFIPEPDADALAPWHPIDDVLGAGSGAPPHPAHAGLGGVPGLDPQVAATLRSAWSELARAWRFQDAEAAGAALATLADTARAINPDIYPPPSRLRWEHWYYRNNKMTWVWLIYLAAIPFLLLATVYGVRRARVAGLALFVVAFGLHTFSIGLRWWLAGRIPNANMFEAITAAAWFGCLTALILEIVLRRWPVRNLPAAAAATGAMVALMVCRFAPLIVQGGDISPVMPVLDRTIWLYIHTNMVIASYALIFFASVTGALYLAMRGIAWLAGAGTVVQRTFAGAGGVGAVPGGAASIILGRGLRPGTDAREVGLARTLDGATMIFLELAFLLLWTGTILGAVWADVSWGRPWGWDPKEVFALNTWIVFLVLVHVRLKVKDKAFWTAVLAVLGCAVMLFNWIVINFQIVGLHSYA
ncbi:MAG: hypothetical protein D6738_07360 [Acidobacteria bacterium]|nr:MAG: hypothetical protein D6738_07360 [Acidobacteriota bacterium]